jgi:hypothetical protein
MGIFCIPSIIPKVEKWWMLEIFFKNLALTNKIIIYNPKTHKIVKVTRKLCTLFYINTLIFIIPTVVALLFNTIQLQLDKSPKRNKDRLLQMIFGLFFATGGSLCILFSYSLHTRMLPMLQTFNSVFLYEDRVKSKSPRRVLVT